MAIDQQSENPSSPFSDGEDGERTDHPLERLEFDANNAMETIARAARDNPHLALAGATVAGFVLGGGLTPRMLGALGLMAARYYLRQTVGETLETIAPRY
jgi:hypothetical protein